MSVWLVQFVVFNQKTAYEMRISNCSSDVCSSDLLDGLVVDDGQADAQDGAGVARVQDAVVIDHPGEEVGQRLLLDHPLDHLLDGEESVGVEDLALLLRGLAGDGLEQHGTMLRPNQIGRGAGRGRGGPSV